MIPEPQWLTPEVKEWFKTRGWRIANGRAYIGDTGSWIRPNPEFWRDRFTLYTQLNKMIIELMQRIEQDKALANAIFT